LILHDDSLRVQLTLLENNISISCSMKSGILSACRAYFDGLGEIPKKFFGTSFGWTKRRIAWESEHPSLMMR